MLHRIAPLALVAGAVLMLAACGRNGGARYSVMGQEPARGANAEVQVQQTPAGNRTVNLNVQWLPPPELLDPRANAYGVWLLPIDGQAPIPAGLLEYDEGNRSGNLAITTPHDHFRIVVTPQDRDAPLDRPGELVVLEHEVMS